MITHHLFSLQLRFPCPLFIGQETGQGCQEGSGR